MGVNQENQSEGHGSSEAAVHHDKLVHRAQLVQSVPVGNTNQDDHSYTAEYRAENNGEDCEPPVPDVFVVNCGHTEEHEDDGFRGT